MGVNAYVYECRDCAVIVHGRDKNPYASNRMYSGTSTTIRAWHVGNDTGAPWHQNRTSCNIDDVVEQCREEYRNNSWSW